ncbi:putative glycolipid-binding domain-containing protein [Rathayibacter sp. VKM Ac-2754]|uniref:putative glycolipid-binding domain-containing protein n=1 Tax=Rathayibacter sp. VKM Ac-2754 TaxID=2609251 RepID=UPI00135CC16F|nr:putative glycolipid-binding domain-containing protein [Rathayibacter sp. VKM Ac-2754]MWV60772.1 hypothetical protein [Rathayibacter sp. VKM Ac-2754]
MRLTALPAGASWDHRGVRAGFEIAFFEVVSAGHRVIGHTTAHESSALWSVGYDVTVDRSWRTVAVQVVNLSVDGRGELILTRDSTGRWAANGEVRPDLDGCLDVDLESSAVTNTLPLHRLDLVEGVGVDVPAAFVRADDLRVERLEQRYTLTEAGSGHLLFHYESSTFDFACDLRYDGSGLVIEYPGIANRAT